MDWTLLALTWWVGGMAGCLWWDYLNVRTQVTIGDLMGMAVVSACLGVIMLLFAACDWLLKLVGRHIDLDFDRVIIRWRR